MCKQCGSPLPVTPDALAQRCAHCSVVTPIYDLASIVRDGIPVFTLPLRVEEETCQKIRQNFQIPDTSKAEFVWCPFWHFRGTVEGFVSGRRYRIGIAGDRVIRVTHRRSLDIDGRLVEAAHFRPNQEPHLEKFELTDDVGQPGPPPKEQKQYILTVDYDSALDEFEELVKRDFLNADSDFCTDRCDRFEVTCKNFRQSLIYLPIRCWVFDDRWILLDGNSGLVTYSRTKPQDAPDDYVPAIRWSNRSYLC